ncbi:hypothetical protein [Pseudomonas sp. ICMP 460]|uniref:hypothetical protein n=1 Tax=Pseudomonas sp. ICMP 460 TaxID=1718917 RepID=UPI0013046846|nr:hypothetical protein [Pseudomonas sp. ICMP 460]
MCAQPGASIVSIALSHDLNANFVDQWIRLQAQNISCSLGLESEQSLTHKCV